MAVKLEGQLPKAVDNLPDLRRADPHINLPKRAVENAIDLARRLKRGPDPLDYERKTPAADGECEVALIVFENPKIIKGADTPNIREVSASAPAVCLASNADVGDLAAFMLAALRNPQTGEKKYPEALDCARQFKQEKQLLTSPSQEEVAVS